MPDLIPTNIFPGILPSDDVLSQCIHCGMCLAVCPTYDLTKLERSSPRGRIKMIKTVSKGEMPVSDIFAEEMNFCLDCQACETACPAGIKYGRLVEAARAMVDENFKRRSLKVRIKRFLLRKILADKNNLKSASRVLRFYQHSFVKNIFERSGILRIFSKNLPEISKLSPKISDFFSDEKIPFLSSPDTEIKYRTAFHFGCIMNVAFAEVNIDTIDVLKAYACEIFTPSGQVCCGSLHAHNGDIEFAKESARRNIDAFGQKNYNYLISNSAGCGAFMKEYKHLLKDDAGYSERAEEFSKKVNDVTEFLYDKKPFIEMKQVNIKAAYHDACHLVHSQKIKNEPRELLKSIPGLILTEMEGSDVCCGSAGIYNITRFEDSLLFLQQKIQNIDKVKPSVVITGNPGCISQIAYGSEKFNCNFDVKHPVSVLKEALYSNIISRK